MAGVYHIHSIKKLTPESNEARGGCATPGALFKEPGPRWNSEDRTDHLSLRWRQGKEKRWFKRMSPGGMLSDGKKKRYGSNKAHPYSLKADAHLFCNQGILVAVGSVSKSVPRPKKGHRWFHAWVVISYCLPPPPLLHVPMLVPRKTSL
jgi:hypothetical protein